MALYFARESRIEDIAGIMIQRNVIMMNAMDGYHVSLQYCSRYVVVQKIENSIR